MPRLLALTYAWLGGAAFVGSLAYTAYFFLTITPGAAEASAGTALGINVALFGLFATHHSVMARDGAKRWLARLLPAELERATYVWTASILLLVTCVWWRDLPGMAYRATGPWWGLGIAVQLTGLMLTLWSAAVLDPLALAGIRQVALGETATESDGVHARGPYRWVRHPIYLGWALMVGGAPEMPLTRLAFAVISTIYLVVAIPWEERSMVTRLGLSYQRYMAHVRWRMVPGLW